MNWIKKLLGIKSPLEKKQAELTKLQQKGFEAQRNGDLRKAGEYYHAAEILGAEIIEMQDTKD
jgi:hypothetical protein